MGLSVAEEVSDYNVGGQTVTDTSDLNDAA